MKYLIMCEGANEKKIIEILMKNQKLKIDYDDLVGRQVYQARQIKNNPNVTTPLKIYGGKVEILRIGDKQSDKLVIPQDFKEQIEKVTLYCTLPELEVLLIISENLYQEFIKVKTTKRAKVFAKENITYNKKRYKNDTKFYEEYYANDITKLIEAICRYRQLNHSHSKEQHYLAELLKERT